MTDVEQKRIFGRNLSRYVDESGKDQKDIAKELGYPATTFNTWCVGKIIPGMGKVQKIADYFGIAKSDLLDDKYSVEVAIENAKLNKDAQLRRMIAYFERLNPEQKDMVEKMIKSLCESNEE